MSNRYCDLGQDTVALQYVIEDSGGVAAAQSSATQGGTFAENYALNVTGGIIPGRYANASLPSDPATGTLAYDTTNDKLVVYTGSGWETVTSSA